MGGAPVIETIRPGAQFTLECAASVRRMETQLRRQIPFNSTYRDYDQQMSMYLAWLAYMNGGPKPPHGRAIAPWASMHCRGEAFDTSLIEVVLTVAYENGWVRVASDEAWHFQRDRSLDRHINEPAAAPDASEEDEMKDSIIVGVPVGDTQVYWIVNVAEFTKARIWNGVQLAFLRDGLGLKEFLNQAPQTLDGMRDLSVKVG